MCGVFGFTGSNHDIESTVGTALRALEYRGYDSWGISWLTDAGIVTQKQTGRLSVGMLPEKPSTGAIGHTRWATHGAVTDANSHPHQSCDGRFSVVHNGIIENAAVIRDALGGDHVLRSSTDSEVVPHLLEDAIADGMDVATAVQHTFSKLDGHNALVVLDRVTKNIYAISSGSPLLVGEGEHGTYVASDVIAFQRLATSMSPLPDGILAQLSTSGVEFRDQHNLIWRRPPMVPVIRRDLVELGADEHFTMKEIAEQPEVIERLLADRHETDALSEAIAQSAMVILTGCGSAYFAARLGASWISRMGGKPALAVQASEFSEVIPFLDPLTLVLVLSQSGETADVVDAIHIAREHDAMVQAIVNVPYSTVARLVDRAYLLHAGIEQSVLATKSFIAKLTRLYLAAERLAYPGIQRGTSLAAIPSTLAMLGQNPETCEQFNSIAGRLAAVNHVFAVGRGTGFASAQEGSLKIKEASYIHAEALPAGELKHGSIALIEAGTPCLIFGVGSGPNAQLLTTSHELRSRGAFTIGIGAGNVESRHSFNEILDLPDFGEASPIAHIFAAQHIAYRAALVRGVNPDRPRNLAKSVTVR